MRSTLAVLVCLGAVMATVPSLALRAREEDPSLVLRARGSADAPPKPRPGSTAELKKLHVILVFDTGAADLALGLRVDQTRVRNLLVQNIPGSRLDMDKSHLFEGKQVTREEILKAVRKLEVGPEDGILFYYGGHGGRTPDGKHFLALRQGRLFRDELRQALDARKAGLVVLLTDCCSNAVKMARVVEDDYGSRPVELVKEIHPTLRDLFFRARGTVDITAASNDRAYGDDISGGLFTQATCRILSTKHKALLARLDTNHDGQLTWVELFPGLKKDTEELFISWLAKIPRGEREGIDHKPQSPMQFSLGRPVSAGSETVAASGRNWAVVSLVNKAARQVKVDYRWTGEETWQSVTLEPGGQTHFSRSLSGPGKEPPLLEARIKGVSALSHMKPRVWTGEGKPGFADGTVYELKPRKAS
jgi:hypothetical protein